MKKKAEDLLQGGGSYNFENSVVLISGNEEGLTFKVQNIIFEKIKSSKSVEKIILDYKDLDKSTLKEKVAGQSLFNEFLFIQINNVGEKIISFIDEIKIEGVTIILIGKNIKSSSKAKKYFDLHKKFYSFACYKLSDSFKKKHIDKFIQKIGLVLTKESYWYLVYNSANEFLLLESELEKISVYKKEKIGLDEMIKLLSSTNKLEFDELYFNSIAGSRSKIIGESEKTIRSSSDAYIFLEVVKSFSKIFTKTSEKKLEQNINSLSRNYLPKYLFKQSNNFELAINKFNFEKIVAINKLLQKTELYLRKNDSNYVMIIQRFLLNFSRIIKWLFL